MRCERQLLVVELVIGEVVAGVDAGSGLASAHDLLIEREVVSVPVDIGTGAVDVHRPLISATTVEPASAPPVVNCGTQAPIFRYRCPTCQAMRVPLRQRGASPCSGTPATHFRPLAGIARVPLLSDRVRPRTRDSHHGLRVIATAIS